MCVEVILTFNTSIDFQHKTDTYSQVISKLCIYKYEMGKKKYLKNITKVDHNCGLSGNNRNPLIVVANL